MKLLLAIFVVVMTIVNADQNRDVFQCRMDTLGMDIAALYIDIEHLEIPKQEPINRFCSKVNEYQRCVSGNKEEESTVELMEAMCTFGFEAIHRNVTCLQMAALASKGLCMPSRRHCAESDVWFLCSQIVTENLCGEKLAFVMATIQHLRCQIFEKPQHVKRVNYDSLPLPVEENEILVPASSKESAHPLRDLTQRVDKPEPEDIASTKTSKSSNSLKTVIKKGAHAKHPEETDTKQQPDEPANKDTEPTRKITKHTNPATTPPKTKHTNPATTPPKTKHTEPATTPPKTKHTDPATTRPKTKHTDPATTRPKTKHTEPATTQTQATQTKPQTTGHTVTQTTKGPITTITPHSTTSSGIKTLPSRGNCVLALFVTAYMMKNF